MQKDIYIYWIGEMPSLVSLLQKMIYHHSEGGKNYRIHLVTPENVTSYTDIPDYFYRLQPAHQADYVRVRVLHDRGGIWLDSDTVVISDLSQLFDLVERHEGFFVLQNNVNIWNGIFGTKPGTPLMRTWVEEMHAKLAVKQENIAWIEIGSRILDRLNRTTDLFSSYKMLPGLDTIYPVNYNRCVQEYIDKPYDNYKTVIRDFQPCLALVNTVYKKVAHLSEREIVEGKFPLSHFLEPYRHLCDG